MKAASYLALLLVAPWSITAAERLPIIDMHLHARRANYMGPNPPPMCAPFVVMPRAETGSAQDFIFNVMPPCADPIPPATTDDAVMRETIAIMKKRNIIGMVSGEPELMKVWRAAAPDRIIPGIDLRLPATAGNSHVTARTVAELRALLFSHPQVYVDIASIVYTEPRPAFYRFLQEIVEAGYGDRIMFGSDQMIWPGVIEPSIKAIEDAPFLSEAQKRDILYNNAARFLRLSPEEMARHHALGKEAALKQSSLSLKSALERPCVLACL